MKCIGLNASPQDVLASVHAFSSCEKTFVIVAGCDTPAMCYRFHNESGAFHYQPVRRRLQRLCRCGDQRRLDVRTRALCWAKSHVRTMNARTASSESLAFMYALCQKTVQRVVCVARSSGGRGWQNCKNVSNSFLKEWKCVPSFPGMHNFSPVAALLWSKKTDPNILLLPSPGPYCFTPLIY